MALILLDLALSIIGGGLIYALFSVVEGIPLMKAGVPVICGIALFFVLTAIQSGSRDMPTNPSQDVHPGGRRRE